MQLDSGLDDQELGATVAAAQRGVGGRAMLINSHRRHCCNPATLAHQADVITATVRAVCVEVSAMQAHPEVIKLTKHGAKVFGCHLVFHVFNNLLLSHGFPCVVNASVESIVYRQVCWG